jgi:tetratricopeptide (TPR) repeat protein
MVLRIFSATVSQRNKTLKQFFSIDQPSAIESVLAEKTEKTSAIKTLKVQNHHRRIPGYWIIVEFHRNVRGVNLFHHVTHLIPQHRIGENVFYPESEMKSRELEEGWNEKYRFAENHQDETCRLFYQEIRSHLKEGRSGNAFIGVMLLLRVNPFFLRKYRRHYILEDLAYHYDQAGNLGKAVRCFKLQAKIRPDSAEPSLNISSFYIMNSMEEKAVQLLKREIKKYPSNQYLMSNLVIAMCNLGFYDAAILLLKKTLQKDPQNGFYWKLLGDVFYEVEENNDAIRSYKKAIKGSFKSKSEDLKADLHSGIAACYYEEGNFKKALEHYQQVLAIYPEDHYTLISLAQLYFYKLKKSGEALKYTRKILEAMPENGYAHYHIGLIYLDLELMEKARWHLYKARRMMPFYNPVHEAIHLLKLNGRNQTGKRLKTSTIMDKRG